MIWQVVCKLTPTHCTAHVRTQYSTVTVQSSRCMRTRDSHVVRKARPAQAENRILLRMRTMYHPQN